MVKMHALLALAAMLAGACTGTASRPLTPAMRERLRAVQGDARHGRCSDL